MSIEQSRPLVIGLTGGVGVGKTVASNYLCERYDVLCIDLDLIGHTLLKKRDVKSDIEATFSLSVFDDDGEVDRKALGTLVFSDFVALQKLNALVHPKIKEEVLSQISTSTQPCIVVGALLKEIDLLECCDHIITIDALESLVEKRIGKKYDISRFQMSRNSYKSLGNSVILNNYTDSFLEELDTVFESVVKSKQ